MHHVLSIQAHFQTEIYLFPYAWVPAHIYTCTIMYLVRRALLSAIGLVQLTADTEIRRARGAIDSDGRDSLSAYVRGARELTLASINMCNPWDDEVNDDGNQYKTQPTCRPGSLSSPLAVVPTAGAVATDQGR